MIKILPLACLAILIGESGLYASSSEDSKNTKTEIVVSQSKISPDGFVSINISLNASPQSTVIQAFYNGSHYVGGGDYGKGGSSRHRSSVVSLDLNPERLPAELDVTKSSWFSRLLLHDGDTKELTMGKRIYFYDFHDNKGIRHYGYIEWKT